MRSDHWQLKSHKTIIRSDNFMSQWWNRQNSLPAHHNPFVSWSSMPGSQPFRLSPHPYPPGFPVPPYPPYHYNPGMYFQQQNNFINTNYPPPNYPYPFAHGQPPVPTAQKQVQNPKKPPATIIIDEDSAIIISDSEGQVITQPKEEEKKVEQVTQKVEAKMEKPDKKETNLQDPRRRLDKECLDPPLNLQPRRCKAEDLLRRYREDNAEQRKTKVVKRRSERFVYRLKPQEKELMRLSGCREAMPGQLMTGPFYQAHLPAFRRSVKFCRWLKLRHDRLMQRLQ